ncbi:MAG: Gfo/Idh/MocA family oxidoreductase [Candidatus Bathyarchaeia archaeon]
MSKAVRLALVGCGFMGTRHLYGFEELKRRGFEAMELAAVCDIDEKRATSVADLAESRLGRRPTVHRDFEQMVKERSDLEAVDLVVEPRLHHVIAEKALKNGLDVLVEKPMGITVKACRRMIQAAEKHHRTLAVAENYRRDPPNRVIAKALREGVIGEPWMAFMYSVGGGNAITITAWRHLKEYGGILLDMGVHYADILLYFMGEVDEVQGSLGLYEKERVRKVQEGDEEKIVERVKPTAEDTVLANLKFASGALGQYAMSLSGHGAGFWQRTVHGSHGSLTAPPDRSGQPITVTMDGGTKLSARQLMEKYRVFERDEVTPRFFPEGMPEYRLPFQDIDRRLIAIEVYDFLEAITTGRKPEVDGTVGMKAEAIIYAMHESAVLGRTVRLRDVESGVVDTYQRSIDEALGI